MATTLRQASESYFFFAALIFAQRAFCAATILARPAALIFPFLEGLAAIGVAPPLLPNSLASCFCKAAILSLRLAAFLN